MNYLQNKDISLNLKIGKVVLGKKPVICAVVQTESDARAVKALKRFGLQLVEVRADKLKPAAVLPALRLLKKNNFSILLTIRMKKEGGAWKFSEEERLKVFKYLLPFVDAVDIELKSSICSEVIRTARSRKKRTIVSVHDFKKTPSVNELNSYMKQARKKGADIVKVVVFARSKKDFSAFTEFTLRHHDEPFISISMGKFGKSSRILFPLLGSLVTYGYLGKKSAPGQFTAEALAKAFRFIG